MKAIVQRRYGPPEQTLTLAEVTQPMPGRDEVLVRVRAASVNALDWHTVEGKPYVARMSTGRARPKFPIRGVDVAGRVEAVGADVKAIKPGDDVVGWCAGAFAEYAVASQDQFVGKPAALSYEESAALPVAGVTALQGLRDKGGLTAGQHVLINGSGGGVGTFAVQIGKALGAEVTAVSKHVELMNSLGADHVIDYTREDFTKVNNRYDLVFDNGASHPLSAVRRTLKAGGTLVLNSGASMPRIAMAIVLSRMGRRVHIFLAHLNQKDLLYLTGLVDTCQLRPIVDRIFPLEETAAAIAYVEAGKARGKVIVNVSESLLPRLHG